MEEHEGMSQTLPDELLEMIIVLMPFPCIFKARSLSKSWLARFSSVSSLDDESKKSLAKLFQKEVSQQSRRWESFSLLFIGKEDLVARAKASQDWGRLPRRESLSPVPSLVNNSVEIAFGRASQNWRRLPSLSFLPHNFLQDNLDLARPCVRIEGPLLYCINHPKREVHVANLLTRTWKQLPPASNPRLWYILRHNLVVDPSSNTYQLILVCREGRTVDFYSDRQLPNLCLRIYDSKSTSWTCKNFVVSAGFISEPAASVYLKGILYMVVTNNPQNLLAINLEEETFEELRLSLQDVTKVVSVHLVVCKGDWLMMVTKGLYSSLQVLKIDLGLLRLVQLANGPPGQLLSPPVGDGNAIYFRIEHGASRVLRYDVDADEWSSFIVPTTFSAQKSKWIGSAFRPGLSPFVAV